MTAAGEDCNEALLEELQHVTPIDGLEICFDMLIGQLKEAKHTATRASAAEQTALEHIRELKASDAYMTHQLALLEQSRCELEGSMSLTGAMLQEKQVRLKQYLFTELDYSLMPNIPQIPSSRWLH